MNILGIKNKAFLKNKNILVGVSASIAIYKSLELIRLYIKAGANVRVVMSEAAKKFITPLTFEAISQNKVLHEETENWDKIQEYNHINMGKWADIFVLAPASANTINKIANGIADNLLTQTILACTRFKIIAMAANTNMIKNPITQENLKKLVKLDFKIINSQVKELVCKDVGDGAMAQVEDIFHISAKHLLKDKYWLDRKVFLTGGGTIEKIDDVRYISNFSSGKMASCLAYALYLKGANVCLISTKACENLPHDMNMIKITNSKQMYEYLTNQMAIVKKEQLKKVLSVDSSKTILANKKPYLFMVAAVCDYIPKEILKGKFKKETIGGNWNLHLKQNIDILDSVDKSDSICVGFKVEMDESSALNNALNMLKKKKLDAVCMNLLKSSTGFGKDENSIELLYKNKSFHFQGNKFDISIQILDNLKEKFNKYD